MPKTQYIQQKEKSQPLFIKRGDILSEFFEISDKAREGGMGDVFFCRDRRDNKFYVLKTFRDINSSPDFLQEVKLCLCLPKHPHVVYSRTVVSTEERYYLVMEFVGQQPYSVDESVHGNTLAYVMKNFTLDQKQALIWAIQICDGMIFLGRCGLKVHRDLKPDNILITPDNEIKISDFGLSVLNRKGGTTGYLAPELADNDNNPTVLSDIYAFGIILYQMLNNGQMPLEDQQIQQSFCGDILKKCLSKNPMDRYKDFQELIKALREVMHMCFPQYVFPDKDPLSQVKDILSTFGWIPSGDSLAEAILDKGRENLSSQELLLKGIGFYLIKQYSIGFLCLSRAITKNPDMIEAYKYRYLCASAKQALSLTWPLERWYVYLFTFLFGAILIHVVDILVYYLTGWLRVGPVLNIIWALGLICYLAQYRDYENTHKKWILGYYAIPALMLWVVDKQILIPPFDYIDWIYLSLLVLAFLFVAVLWRRRSSIWSIRKMPVRVIWLIIWLIIKFLIRSLCQMYKYYFQYCFNHDQDKFSCDSKGKSFDISHSLLSSQTAEYERARQKILKNPESYPFDLVLYHNILSLHKQPTLDESLFFQYCEKLEKKTDYHSITLYLTLWEKIKFFHSRQRKSQEYDEWRKIITLFYQLNKHSPLSLTNVVNNSNDEFLHNLKVNWTFVKWLALLGYLKLERKDDEACFLLARCYHELSDYSSAMYYYQQLVDKGDNLNFNIVDKKTARIVEQFNCKFFDENRILYMETSKSIDIYFYLGICQRRCGKNKEAFLNFTRAIALEPVQENKKIIHVFRRVTVPWWKIYRGWLKDTWSYFDCHFTLH